jgi:hypothetical protein
MLTKNIQQCCYWGNNLITAVWIWQVDKTAWSPLLIEDNMYGT